MMKPARILLIISAFIFCRHYSIAFSFQGGAGDTLNQMDANYLKQGYWIFYGKDRRILTGYAPDQKVEEGMFENNMKTGIWKKYFSNGKIESEVTYRSNRPDGYAKIYYENGNIKEEGLWLINKWMGEYKFYYETGEVYQDFQFNEKGKRDGDQKYFHDNGNKMIEGSWNEGKENGTVSEYNRDGALVVERYYQDGQMNPAKTVVHMEQDMVQKPDIASGTKKTEPAKEPAIVDIAQEKPNIGVFTGNGYHRLFNQNKQVSKDGTFKNYKLMDGKWYRYDENGMLIRIERWKNGTYAGDIPIEEDIDEGPKE